MDEKLNYALRHAVEHGISARLSPEHTKELWNIVCNNPREPEHYTPVEIKSLGQLVDELSILNIRIWILIDRVMNGNATVEDGMLVQQYNAKRTEYIRAIDRRVGERSIEEKTYKGE